MVESTIRSLCSSLHLVTPAAGKRAAQVEAFMDCAHALLLRQPGTQLEPR